MSRCKGCGAEIIWIPMQSGKKMPCDPALIQFWWEPEGPETFITQEGETVRGSRDGDAEEMTDLGYIPHFVTCPKADEFRKKR